MEICINPNLGSFFRSSFWGGRGKITPCLKLVRIMLEKSNLARKYTPLCNFRKCPFEFLDPLNFADVSIFLQKISVFLSKKVPLLKAIVWKLCEIFSSSVCSFCKKKGYYYWKHSFCRLCIRNTASGLLQIGQKSEKWQWRHSFRNDVNINFFKSCFIFLVKFSY